MKASRLIFAAAIVLTAVFAVLATGCKKVQTHYPDRTYLVTYNSNGGSAVNAVIVTHGDLLAEPAAPTMATYTFQGWFTDNGTFADKWDFASRHVFRETTLYAKWGRNTHEVAFESNGGSAVDTLTVNEGDAMDAPTAPTRASYTFAGWFSDSGLTTQVTFPLTVTTDITLYANWLEGTGIYTAADLNNVRNNLSGSYVLMADIDLAAAGYSNWTPVGTDNNTSFTGKFNGNGHKITNLVINVNNGPGAGYYDGLFGYISGGSVSNLGVEVEISGTGADGQCTGGIAGHVESGSITGCYATGSVSSSISPIGIGGSVSGGIAGEVDHGTITNCYSTGNVSATGNTTANSHSGGIAGEVDSGTITNCYSTGNVSATGAGGSASGGIAGFVAAGGAITNCAAINSSVDATDLSSNAGRVVGNVFSGSNTISNNFALSSMTVTGDQSSANNGTGKDISALQGASAQATYSGTVNGDGLGGLGWAFGSSPAAPWKMGAAGFPIFYWQK